MAKYKLIYIEKINYQDALSLQKILQNKVIANPEEQYLLALTHPDVITSGRRGFCDNLKHEKSFYQDQGIELVESDRGGLTTYHGPGQLVLYFIVNLQDLKLGIKDFVGKVEQAVIKTLSFYKINAEKIEGKRGVFVSNNKIAAVGMQVKHQVTNHGIALNIHTNLKNFTYFTPCGLTDVGVTSIEKEGVDVPFYDVLSLLVENISMHLEVDIERTGEY